MNSKLYRCGWCGNITDCMGEPLEEEPWKRVAELFRVYGHYRVYKVNGNCCRHEGI